MSSELTNHFKGALPGKDPALQRRVLITGAGGFIASHLVEACVEQGWKVSAMVRYNSRSNWGWLEESPARNAIEVVVGDVRDYDSVSRAMEGCDTVFHLAALIGIPYSYVSPLAYIRTNVEGTYNVLEAARRLGGVKVLITSTSETYGTAQYTPMDEKHPSVAQSPYAASKIAADQLALSYFRSFQMPVRVVRPFNTYGPRQSSRAVIPTIISQLLSGNTRLNLGNLTPTRDYTFVKDTVAGFVALANHDGYDGQPVNIGTATEISIGDLAQRIGSCLGMEVAMRTDAGRVRRNGSEVERLVCDNQRIKNLTGWSPTYDLDRGLQETIEWMRLHLQCFKPDHYTV